MILGAVIATLSPTPPNETMVGVPKSIIKSAASGVNATFNSHTRDQRSVSIRTSYIQNYRYSNIILQSFQDKNLTIERILAILLTNPTYLMKMHINICMSTTIIPNRLESSVWNKKMNSLRFVDAIVSYCRFKNFFYRLLIPFPFYLFQ